ncbi:MAG TPA: hypothetical protein V6C97_33735 [Oculatellaceae cyanobacterium]
MRRPTAAERHLGQLAPCTPIEARRLKIGSGEEVRIYSAQRPDGAAKVRVEREALGFIHCEHPTLRLSYNPENLSGDASPNAGLGERLVKQYLFASFAPPRVHACRILKSKSPARERSGIHKPIV